MKRSIPTCGSYALRRFLILDLVIVLGMLMLAIPIGLYVVQQANRTAQEDITQRFNALADDWNQRIIGLYSNMMLLQNNREIGRLSRVEGELDSQLYYTVNQSRKHLSNIFLGYDEVAEAFLFFEKSSLLVTNLRSFINRDTYFKHFFNSTNTEKDALMQQIQACTANLMLLPEIRGEVTEISGMSASYLPLIVTISNSHIKLLVLWEGDTFLEHFGTESYGASLAITNKEGTALFLSGDAEDPVLFSYPIPSLGCTLTLGVPRSYFNQQIAPIFRLMLIYAVILLLLGGLLAIAVAWHATQPIRELTSLMPAEFKKDTNEYRSIERTLRHLNLSNEQLLLKTQQLQESVARSVFGQLLFNHTFALTHRKHAEQLLLTLKGSFRVGVVRVEASDHDAQIDTAFVIDELNDIGMTYMLDESRAALLIAEDQLPVLERKLQELSEPFTLSAAVSEPCREAGQIAGAFSLVMDQLDFIGDGMPLKVCTKAPLSKYLLSFEELRSLYELMRSHAQEQLLYQLNQIRSTQQFSSHQRRILYGCFEMMLQTVSQEYGLLSDKPVLPPYDRDLTTADLFDAFTEACAALCTCIEEKRQKGNMELKQNIVDYVDANLCDPDIYAEKIASDCNLSVKYLHKIFREYTGESVSDYIEARRMAKACDMLAGSSASISVISDACGFRSLNTFYKAFKRVKGASPSEWRSNHQQNP